MSTITASIGDITYSSYKISWTDSLTILGAGLTYYEDGVSKGYVDVTGLSDYTVPVSEGIDFSTSLLINDADGNHYSTPGGTSILRAPVASSATVVSSTEIQTDWTCDAGTESGFRVYYGVSPDHSTLGKTVAANETNGTVGGLAAGNTYAFVVQAYNSYTTSDDSNAVTAYLGASYSDTTTDTVTASDSGTTAHATVDTTTDTVTASDVATTAATLFLTETDTVTASDLANSSQTIHTDFAYYIGTSDGYVHETKSSYLSDNGSSITSVWISKTLDFAEDDTQNTGKWKTIDRIDYVYKEDYTSVPTVFKVSNDGGSTWSTVSKSLGSTGDGRIEHASFFYNKTGQFFVVKIEWASADKAFQFLGFDVVYYDQGEQWDVV